MNGYDLQKYLQTKDRANELDMNITFKGSQLVLVNKITFGNFGYFETLDELYNFVCGYETAHAKLIYYKQIYDDERTSKKERE